MMTHRFCWILQGEHQWHLQTVSELLKTISHQSLLVVSDSKFDGLASIEYCQVKSHLGKEYDVAVFDGKKPFSADNLGIIIGTVKAGGGLILLLAENNDASLWMRRFRQVITEFEQLSPSFLTIKEGNNLPTLALPGQQQSTDSSYHTPDQQQAVTAILNVVHGHRRRPLVLSADRGRGKSASLGIAAAQLIQQGKKSILVTAPSLSTADTVFEHAGRLLPTATIKAGKLAIDDAEIQFIAPDALLESAPKADLLLVDEAAAIPASILETLLHQYSRIVFATTLHGYEGTGRGFSVRFQHVLQQTTPNWHHYRMQTPIRWAEDDPLEKFSFRALLLDAEPVVDDLVKDAQVELCHFEQCDRNLLVKDEQSLRELFGLMVLAHYRTRPSDLQMMLDREDITIYAMRYQGHIIASAWTVNEGALDDDVAIGVHAGTRRLKGHLLPQSLLAHAGITTAGSMNYQRIIRIAVHPALQQRGIGQALLQLMTQKAERDSVDVVGASFGASLELLAFWSKSGFVPVRLGIHKGDVTGSHAVMFLQALSSKGKQLLNDSRRRFQQQWPHLLGHQFAELDSDLVTALSQLFEPQQTDLSQWERQDIDAFAHAQHGYEFSQVALWLWLRPIISHPDFMRLTHQQQQMCVMTILQQRQWSDIAKQLGFTGKSEIITALRATVRVLLSFRQCDS